MPTVEDKFIETYFRDIFSRPFARRFKYLYFGLERTPDLFVLSDTEDTKFKYCEPMQATGLVKVHNLEHLDFLRTWFAQWGVDNQTPYLFYFAQWLSLKTNTTAKGPPLVLTRQDNGVITASVGEITDVLIARPIDSYFTLLKLQIIVDKYQAVFFTAKTPSYTLEIEVDPTKKPDPHMVSCAALYAAQILDVPCHDIRLVLIPGLEVIMPKSLLQKNHPHTSGIRVWADSSPRCLGYGGYYTDANLSLCAARDNIFIFPILKQQG